MTANSSMPKLLKFNASLKHEKFRPGNLEKSTEFGKIRNFRGTRCSKMLNSREPKTNSSRKDSIGLKSKDSTRLWSKQREDRE